MIKKGKKVRKNMKVAEEIVKLIWKGDEGGKGRKEGRYTVGREMGLLVTEAGY